MIFPSNLDQEVASLLADRSSPRCWVVGGAVRRALRAEGPLKDVDVVVNNEDFDQAVLWLSTRYGQFELNRYGNPRFSLSPAATIDLWSPARFFGGYSSVWSMFARFDFTCNCVGLSNDGRMISRFSAQDDIELGLLRPVDGAWSTASPEELARLVGRAIKMVLFRRFEPVPSPAYRHGVESLKEDSLVSEFGHTRKFAREVLIERGSSISLE